MLQLPNAQEAEDDLITEDWSKSGLFKVVQELNNDCLAKKDFVNSDQALQPENGSRGKNHSWEEKLK